MTGSTTPEWASMNVAFILYGEYRLHVRTQG